MNYNPKIIEKEIYKFWEKENLYKYNNNEKNNFCILLPPLNITGNLHIGHAFQQTIIDLLARFNRMNGKNVLLQPGFDHAGIATQLLIEKKYNNKKINFKKDFYIKKTIEWKKNISKYTIHQMKSLGNSIYWDNIRFTMDKNFIHSVQYAFIKLYKKNLIYKSKNIINWDVKIQSSISDLEVSYKKNKCKIWYIKYPIVEYTNKNKYIIISTTRPETLLGNVAIAINPKDNRYKNLIGKNVIVPIINKKIPIIYDNSIDINFGNGCMQVTPAHSFNDYNIAIKNSLSIINIISLNGKIREKAEIINCINSYKHEISYYNIPNNLINLNVIEARKKIINMLKLLNLIHKEENHISNIPYNSRSNSIIEPIVTDQWYLKTKELSKKSIKIIKENYIKIFPDKYKNVYFKWMKNIKDWCISRQIWWGHKIPIWYDDNNNIYTGFNEINVRKKYNLKDINLYQDNNVLDTWFSSGLWSIASLGWPKKTKKIKMFYPTDIIISGNDIIFFWISRMIMLSINLINNKKVEKILPFKEIYITGIINDKYGKKMSKSNGNIINPMDIINGKSSKNLSKEENLKLNIKNDIKECGADSLRLTFLSLSTNNKNINFNIEKVYGYKNFCNKIWNASQYILKNCNINYNNNIKYNNLLFINKYILSRLNKIIYKSNKYINTYKFNKLIQILYNFFWNEFCNYYIEITKYYLFNNTCKNKEKNKNEIKNILLHVINVFLKLLHPSAPFITEKIWKLLNFNLNNNKTISLQKFPQYDKNFINIICEKEFKTIKNIIYIIRKEKIKYNKDIIKIKINENIFDVIKKNIKIIKYLTNINNIIINNVIV